MFNQIRIIVRGIIKKVLKTIIAAITFSFRDKKVILLGLRTPVTLTDNNSKDYLMHNTKYLLLKYGRIKEYKFIYLCDDEKIKSSLEKIGFTVYKRKNPKGIYYALKAKYWFYDDIKRSVSNVYLSSGATCINLWHGAGGLKKVGFDCNHYYPTLSNRWKNFLVDKDSFYVVNSKYESECRKSAFRVNDEKIKILGSPRLDVLYEDIPHAELFMEEDFAKIKNFKEQGKKLFFYTPTWRDTGKDISSWLKSNKLKQFLKDNNAILICKLHFADKNSLNFELTEEFYKMDSESDIYPVLKYSDALITDYSSIYFDYLHLNKPIIYHIPDLEEYETQCRGFYRSYETLTAGEYTRTEEELLNAMQNVVNGVDNYKDRRKALLDEMFVYQDGKNCERIVEWIKSLN